ncbi:MAG: ABC transporter substrate-binding protein [Stenotrophomonas sp.]
MKRRDLLRAFALAPLLPTALSPAWAANARRSTLAATFGALPAPTSVSRVFAAGAPAAVLAYVLAPAKLLGWPMSMSPQARALLAPAQRELPQLGRLSGRGSTVSTESLLTLRPDLILDAGTVSATYVSGAEKVWQQTGLPYTLIEGQLAEHPAQLREVGRLLGAAERGGQLAAHAEKVIALTHLLLAAIPPDARPKVYYGRGPDGLETGLQGSINMEVVEFAGGRNVAAQAGKGGLTRVSMEQLLAWNPDVVLTQDADFARRIATDPLWRSITAVRNRRVHLAPSLPFGWLDGPPGVNRLIGLHWLLSKLYPGRHPALAADKINVAIIEFHRLFYGRALTLPELEKLLAGTA